MDKYDDTFLEGTSGRKMETEIDVVSLDDHIQEYSMQAQLMG